MVEICFEEAEAEKEEPMLLGLVVWVFPMLLVPATVENFGQMSRRMSSTTSDEALSPASAPDGTGRFPPTAVACGQQPSLGSCLHLQPVRIYANRSRGGLPVAD